MSDEVCSKHVWSIDKSVIFQDINEEELARFVRLRVSEGSVEEIQSFFVYFLVSKHFFDDSTHVAAHKVDANHLRWLKLEAKYAIRVFCALYFA